MSHASLMHDLMLKHILSNHLCSFLEHARNYYSSFCSFEPVTFYKAFLASSAPRRSKRCLPTQAPGVECPTASANRKVSQTAKNYQSIHPSIYLCVSICFSIYLSIYLSICLSIYLSSI